MMLRFNLKTELIVCLFALTVGLLAPLTALSDSKPDNLAVDVAHASIDELLNMPVTTISKAPEPYWTSAAAVYVLSNERILRSGVTTLPEALRLIPGVQVARVNGNKWAVSIRGFNSQTSNKLLVLIDGRSIYDQIFSGVLWESKDVMLQDVERIEVIRGPGGTIWGSNAVNGVINIITKTARDTQDGLLYLASGNEEHSIANVRYGVRAGDDSYLRVYGKSRQVDGGYRDGGLEEDSSFSQSGFRFDSYFGEYDNLTLQGDIYEGKQGDPDSANPSDEGTSGGNFLFQGNRYLSPDSQLTLLSYYDRTDISTAYLGETRDTFIVDLQHRYQIEEGNQLVTGLRTGYSRDSVTNSDLIALDPRERTNTGLVLFAEDKASLIADKLFLTIGTRINYRDRNSIKLTNQPSVSLAWAVNPTNTVWWQIARTLRLPSRIEQDAVIPLADGDLFRGNPDLNSEKLVSQGLGYRTHPTENLLLDFSTFYNSYEDLVSVERTTVGNKSSANTYGFEALSTWHPYDVWRLELAYSYLKMDLFLDHDSLATQNSIVSVEKGNPRNQLSLQSILDITPAWHLDMALRYVDSLSSLNVPGYLVADIRVAHALTRNIEVSLVGQNLFNNRHFEQSPATSTTTQVQQGVFAALRWRF